MALVVASKIKETIRKNKMNTASDFIPALEKYLTEEIGRACRRCASNGRKTVRGADL